MSKNSLDSVSKKEKDSKGSRTSFKSFNSKSSYEEGDFVDYDYFIDDKKQVGLPPKTKDYYYQDYSYVRPTQSDFDRKEVAGSKLFDKTKKIQVEESFIKDEEPTRDASILISGFGMRNVQSFQKLVKMSHDEREKWELRKLWRDQYGKSIKSREEDELTKGAGSRSARTETTETSTSTEPPSRRSSSDFLTQTETTIKTSAVREDMRHLDYLLGLDAQMEEEPEPFVDIEVEESEDDFKYSTSKSVREAQRYLRVHRIFECFQFIVAHLLSARAENPIEFILNLLNRCLLYRSGLGEPQLLYQHKHINKLFDLMDRLQTGFIDIQQYATGMKTLGICSYNEDPEVNDDGMISKEIFVEEAYEAELAIFDDLIKRRPEKNKTKIKKLPAALSSVSVPSLNPPYFIPSDLFKFSKTKIDVVLDDGGE